jgi:catechol 2,3-dioxygenase-like lactoylglutathione lyase family enzyme
VTVQGLDHVNIIADDLDETGRFYEDLLGLRYTPRPGEMDFRGAWLMDAAGQPIIHLMTWNAERHAGFERGTATGAIDHVALACEDFEGTLARCAELGVEHRVNDRKYGDLRQIFVRDPNKVMLELNFRDA